MTLRWPWQLRSFIYIGQVCCQNPCEMAMTALKFYLPCPSLLPKSLWDAHDSPEVLFTLPKFAAQMTLEMLMTAQKLYLHWPSLLPKWLDATTALKSYIHCCCQNPCEMAMTAQKFYLHWPSLLPKCLWDGHDSPEVLFTCPSLLPKWLWGGHDSYEVLFTFAKFIAKIKAKMLAISTCDSHCCTCLGHLGGRNTNRIGSIMRHVTQGGQSEYDSECRMLILPAFLPWFW